MQGVALTLSSARVYIPIPKAVSFVPPTSIPLEYTDFDQNRHRRSQLRQKPPRLHRQRLKMLRPLSPLQLGKLDQFPSLSRRSSLGKRRRLDPLRIPSPQLLGFASGSNTQIFPQYCTTGWYHDHGTRLYRPFGFKAESVFRCCDA
jgi:hypothetical protein